VLPAPGSLSGNEGKLVYGSRTLNKKGGQRRMRGGRGHARPGVKSPIKAKRKGARNMEKRILKDCSTRPGDED